MYGGVRRYLPSLLATTLALAFIVLLVLPMLLNGGSLLAVVKGYSMLPTLREGDVVLLEKTPPDSIKPGDIVIYSAGDRLIIHRVIDVEVRDGRYYYVTKGDNNSVPDLIYFEDGLGVPYERVLGRVVGFNGYVFKIPYLGYISLFFRRT